MVLLLFRPLVANETLEYRIGIKTSSINDVTVLGFCDNRNKASVIKRLTVREGVRKMSVKCA